MLTQKIIDGMRVHHQPEGTIILKSITKEHFEELVLLASAMLLANRRIEEYTSNYASLYCAGHLYEIEERNDQY